MVTLPTRISKVNNGESNIFTKHHNSNNTVYRVLCNSLSDHQIIYNCDTMVMNREDEEWLHCSRTLWYLEHMNSVNELDHVDIMNKLDPNLNSDLNANYS